MDTQPILYIFARCSMILSTAGGTRHREQNVNTYGEYIKNRRGCQRKRAAEVQNMSKEEMIAEIQRVLEDANEWEVAEIHAFVMDEVG